MSRFSLTDTREAPLVLRMGVTRNGEEEKVTMTQGKYTKCLLGRYAMGNCNSTYTPDVERELSLDGGEAAGQGRQKAVLGHYGQHDVPRTGDSLGILYSVNQLARVTSKPSKALMAAVKHLLR